MCVCVWEFACACRYSGRACVGVCLGVRVFVHAGAVDARVCLGVCVCLQVQWTRVCGCVCVWVCVFVCGCVWVGVCVHAGAVTMCERLRTCL